MTDSLAASLSRAATGLTDAAESIAAAVALINRTVDRASATANGGAKTFPATVLWGELARAGMGVDLRRISDFCARLADAGDVIGNAADLCAAIDGGGDGEPADAAVAAGTVCSVLSSLLDVSASASASSPSLSPAARSAERTSFRAARPLVLEFMTQSFGEFHRKLVSGDAPASSPTLAAAAAAGPVAAAAASAGAKSGGGRKVVRRRGGHQRRKSGSRASSVNGDAAPEDPAPASPAAAVDETASQQQQPPEDDAASPSTKPGGKGASRRGTRGAKAAQAQQAPEQPDDAATMVSNNSLVMLPQVLLPLGDYVLASATDTNIEASLPYAQRSELQGRFTPFGVLLAGRTTRPQTVPLELPRGTGSASASMSRLLETLTDAALDLEIGAEMDLLSLSQFAASPPSDGAPSAAAAVPEWQPLVSQGGDGARVSVGFKSVALGGEKRGGTLGSPGRGGGGGARWESIFALLRREDSGGTREFVRQDAFYLGGGGAGGGSGSRARDTRTVETVMVLRMSSTGSCTFTTAASLVDAGAPASVASLGATYTRIVSELVCAAAASLVRESNGGTTASGGGGGRGNGGGDNNKKRDNLLVVSRAGRSNEERANLDAGVAALQKKQQEQEEESSSMFVSALTAPVRLVGRVAGAVADVAGSAVRNQQLAFFRRNFDGADPASIQEVYNAALLPPGAMVVIQGLLFVCDTHLRFAPTTFVGGDNAKVILPWRSVKRIDKKSFMSFQNAVEVETFDRQTHFFTSFLSRDDAVERMFSAWRG